jgi:putative DNA primase/helicase
MAPALESHLAKYRKLVPALALINHLADGGIGAIAERAALRAIVFSEYLKTHARRAYGAGLSAETTAAKAILQHLRRGDLKDGFMAREIRRKEWSGRRLRKSRPDSLSFRTSIGLLQRRRRQADASAQPTRSIRGRGNEQISRPA